MDRELDSARLNEFIESSPEFLITYFRIRLVISKSIIIIK